MSSLAAAAGNKYINIRTGLFEIGSGNIGLGVGRDYLFSMSETDSVGNYTVSGSSLLGRLTLYSSGMGNNSWYLAGSAGTMEIDFNRSLSGVNYQAKGFADYESYSIGYHWFWESFNFNLGVVNKMFSLRKIHFTDASDNTVNTIQNSKVEYITGEIGIGWMF